MTAGGGNPLGRDWNGDGKGAGCGVPSLLGGRMAPPYYHNGACETLLCVVNDPVHRTANGTIPDGLAVKRKRRLVSRFLEGLGAATAAFPPS